MRVFGLSAKKLFKESHSQLLYEKEIRDGLQRRYFWAGTELGQGLCFRAFKKYGIFQIWTKEFVGAFAEHLRLTLLKSDSLILDVGAGNGLLPLWLRRSGFNIVAVDSRSSQWHFTKKFVPDCIVDMDYSEALEKFKPELVICSWMPPYEDWGWVFKRSKSVNKYILIGAPRGDYPIPDKQNHYLCVDGCGKVGTFFGANTWHRKELKHLNALSFCCFDLIEHYVECGVKSIMVEFERPQRQIDGVIYETK